MDPELIKYTKNPSEDDQMDAIQWTPDMMKYIKNPTKNVKQLYKNLTQEK